MRVFMRLGDCKGLKLDADVPTHCVLKVWCYSLLLDPRSPIPSCQIGRSPWQDLGLMRHGSHDPVNQTLWLLITESHLADTVLTCARRHLALSAFPNLLLGFGQFPPNALEDLSIQDDQSYEY